MTWRRGEDGKRLISWQGACRHCHGAWGRLEMRDVPLLGQRWRMRCERCGQATGGSPGWQRAVRRWQRAAMLGMLARALAKAKHMLTMARLWGMY